EEVEADPGATSQAFTVVLLSSVAAGIGSRGLGGTTWQGAAFIAGVSLIAWAARALVVFEVGGRGLPAPQTRAGARQGRVAPGFAAAPGLLRVLGVMSSATIPVFIVTSVWMLAAMVVAVRQALDFESTSRAIAVCALGWALAILIAVVIGLFFSPPV